MRFAAVCHQRCGDLGIIEADAAPVNCPQCGNPLLEAPVDIDIDQHTLKTVGDSDSPEPETPPIDPSPSPDGIEVGAAPTAEPPPSSPAEPDPDFREVGEPAPVTVPAGVVGEVLHKVEDVLKHVFTEGGGGRSRE